MEKKVKLLPPTMPNFVSMGQQPEEKEDNSKIRWIAITEFTEKEAEEYGEFMKQTFIKHWKEKAVMLKGKSAV